MSFYLTHRCLFIMCSVAFVLCSNGGAAQGFPAFDASNGSRAGQERGETAQPVLLLQRAEAGNTTSQFLVGRMYALGHGVPTDYQEAAKWWSRAAEKGNASAQNELGYAYAHGRGISRNLAAAFHLYEAAAAQGLPAAQFNLAVYPPGARFVFRRHSFRWARYCAFMFFALPERV